jgi:hypothetical protein
MTVEIQRLNGHGNFMLLGSAMGLGATLTDAEIQAMAIELAPKTKFAAGFSHIDSYELASLLSNYDRDTQQRIGAAIIGAGGDAVVVGGALTRIEAANGYADNGYHRKRTLGGVAWGVASTASAAASAYHGYRRNDSLGWGLWWFLMGALFPIVTPVIALAQGYGKPRGM